MKKFLKLFAFAFCFAISSVAFLACGANTVALTEENVVGVYEVTTVSYTTSGENAKTTTCTKTEFEAMTSSDENYDLFRGMFETYDVNEDGNIYVETYPIATWAIEDNKLVYDAGSSGFDADSVEWDNGKIIITVTINDAEVGDKLVVLTLEK